MIVFLVMGKLRTFNFLDGLEDFLDTIFTVQTDFHFHNLMVTCNKKNLLSLIVANRKHEVSKRLTFAMRRSRRGVCKTPRLGQRWEVEEKETKEKKRSGVLMIYGTAWNGANTRWNWILNVNYGSFYFL